MKYRIGDCLSIKYPEKYLAALITGIYKSYYDITLVEYHKRKGPEKDDFVKSRFFGTRFGSLERITYAVDKCMVNKKYVDKTEDIELVSNLNIYPRIQKAGYQYNDNIKDILSYYDDEIGIRKEKTKNAERFPEIGFVSKHLIDIKHIIEL